jgi:hypothetical protein
MHVSAEGAGQDTGSSDSMHTYQVHPRAGHEGPEGEEI